MLNLTLDLSTQTLDWLAHHPRARQFVRSVWDTLTDLERAGQQPEAIAALRRVLDHPRPISLIDDQKRVVTVVVDAVTRRLQPATLTLRVQRLGDVRYVDHE